MAVANFGTCYLSPKDLKRARRWMDGAGINKSKFLGQSVMEAVEKWEKEQGIYEKEAERVPCPE